MQAWYGELHILHGVDFDVRPGEVVTLLGRNGAGKTTTLKSIMGIVGKRKGSAKFDGPRDVGLPSERIARLGIAICPEERGIFASLSVRENLMLPPRVAQTGGLELERIFALFPNLKERLDSGGGKLSGGEQQMLAIARILRTGARFLMLDEPTEGLAPVIIQQIGRTIAELKREGFTILLVEQNFRFASTVADRYYVMEHGKIIDAFANSPNSPRTWTSCMSIWAFEDGSRQRVAVGSRMRRALESYAPSRASAALPTARLPKAAREPPMILFGHVITAPAALRPAADRPDQRLVLRAAEPRPRRHLRHAQHRQFRPWRVLHGRRLRRLFPAAAAGINYWGALILVADHRRRARRRGRAHAPQAHRRPRSLYGLLLTFGLALVIQGLFQN